VKKGNSGGRVRREGVREGGGGGRWQGEGDGGVTRKVRGRGEEEWK